MKKLQMITLNFALALTLSFAIACGSDKKDSDDSGSTGSGGTGGGGATAGATTGGAATGGRAATAGATTGGAATGGTATGGAATGGAATGGAATAGATGGATGGDKGQCKVQKQGSCTFEMCSKDGKTVNIYSKGKNYGACNSQAGEEALKSCITPIVAKIMSETGCNPQG